jgi:tRNA-specific 2-thiouridylase
MSGGVDSSVAAALLAEQGHDVIGLSMQLYDQNGGQAFGSCCTLDDLHDARRVAAAIGIPHYILNFERRFEETVISNFVHEYASGRTPLPVPRHVRGAKGHGERVRVRIAFSSL